ncbi:MAG: hypothetical protein QW512_06670 [Thermofilaceae archaeon]
MRIKPLVFFLLLVLLLIPHAYSSSQVYSIRVKSRLNDGSYGIIVPLEGGYYTSFLYEKHGSHEVASCTNVFVKQMVELLGLNITIENYVECTSGGAVVFVDRAPAARKELVVQFNIVAGVKEAYYGYIALAAGPFVATYEVSEVELEVSTTTAGGGGGRGFSIWDVFGALKAFIEAVWRSLQLLGQALATAAQAFSAIGEALGAVAAWIGKPGDPDAIFYYNFYRLQLIGVSDTPIAREVLACKRPIRDALHLTDTSVVHRYTDKTLCELEKMQPSGFLGSLQIAFTVAVRARDVLSIIVQNFVLINIAVIGLILIQGVYESVSKKNLDGISKAVNRIYAVFRFYWSVIKFIAELVWRIIQTVAQFLSAVLPF